MNEPNETRESVLRRAQEGDATEFARLYVPLTYAMAIKVGLDEPDARDVMQQTLLELLELLPHFEYDPTRGTFKGLIKKIVRSRAIDLVRARRRFCAENAAEASSDPFEYFDAMFEREWRKAHWMAALDRVRSEVRPTTFQSFQLYVLREMPIDEVAAILGLTNNQVSQNKRRIIQRLRAHFEEMDDEP